MRQTVSELSGMRVLYAPGESREGVPPPEAARRPLEGRARRHSAFDALPDFSSQLPTDYREKYLAWRIGKPFGAKGEAAAKVFGTERSLQTAELPLRQKSS